MTIKLFKVVMIQARMQMVTVMISITTKPAFLMVEIVVVVLLMKNIAQNVYVLKAVELQHLLESAMRDGLQMGIVMISTTIQPAPTMEEIAVDVMSKHNTAQNVYVLKEEEGTVVELQHHVDLQQLWELQLQGISWQSEQSNSALLRIYIQIFADILNPTYS